MGEAAVGVEAAHAAPLEGVVAAAGLGVVAARETLAGGRLGLGFALTLGRPSNWPGAPPSPPSPLSWSSWAGSGGPLFPGTSHLRWAIYRLAQLGAG